MRRILAIDNWDQRLAEIRFLVRELPREDIPTALAVLTERNPEDWEHLRAFIESWVGRDPEAAIAFVESRPPRFSEKYYWEALMKGWVRLSPEEAWRHVSALPADRSGELRLNCWVSALSNIDAPRTLALLSTAPDRIRDSHFAAIFYNWPADQFDAALDAIAGIDNQTWSKKALEALLDSPANTQGLSLLQKISDRFGEEVRKSLEKQFYQAWVKKDPLAAMAQVRLIADPEARDRAMDGLDYHSTNDHFEIQIQLIDDFGKDEKRRRASRSYLIQKWLMKDPESAEDFVAGLPVEEQGDYVNAFGYYFAQRDPTRALAWAQQLGNAATRDAFLTQFLKELVPRDFDLALNVMENITSPAPVEAATAEIASAYARRDPAAAMGWALENCPEAQLPEAAEHAMRRWATTDLAAASEWLAEQETGKVRDAATTGMADALQASGERQAAMELALEIGGVGARHGTLFKLSRGWAERDARGFQAWLSKQNADVQNAVRADEAFGWLIDNDD